MIWSTILDVDCSWVLLIIIALFKVCKACSKVVYFSADKTAETACSCSVLVSSYTRNASNDRCPVLSFIIFFSGTPTSKSLEARHTKGMIGFVSFYASFLTHIFQHGRKKKNPMGTAQN